MLRLAVLLALILCVAAAPAAAADPAPDAAAPGTAVTSPAAPPPAEPSRAKRPPIDPVEERIKYLHERLRITTAQEPLWSDVASAMRDNAKAVAPLIRQRVQAAERGSAIDNIDSYEKLGEAQLDGLKRFLAAFQALYDALSRDQKKIADSLFRIGPLGMIGGIPPLAEAIMAPPLALPSIAGVGYPPYPIMPVYPGYAPPPYALGPAYAVFPRHFYYPPEPPSFLYPPYYPPFVAYPFYSYRPWVGAPPAGYLVGGRLIVQHAHGGGMPHH
jgi:hypothetical protein